MAPSSSEFSSVIQNNLPSQSIVKPGSVPLQLCQESYEGGHQSSYFESQLSESSFQLAEQNAITEEEIARKRRFEKEQKLREF